MAGEKNPLPQLRRPRDFVMELGMPKTLLPFDHDKDAYVYILYGINLDLTIYTQTDQSSYKSCTHFTHSRKKPEPLSVLLREADQPLPDLAIGPYRFAELHDHLPYKHKHKQNCVSISFYARKRFQLEWELD